MVDMRGDDHKNKIWHKVFGKILWHLLIIQLAVILVLKLPVKDSLIWFMEIFPPVFFLLHVLFVAYDRTQFPEYHSVMTSFLERCDRSPRSVLLHVLIAESLVGGWVVVLAYFVGLDSAIFAGVVVLLAFFLDARKGWLGAKSFSCLLLQGIGLGRSA